ncbi:MAG: cysteine desulfurase family protein [Bacteroidetes bacterium]|nr:cysteine desulfurase family protein [Bacteroidota bacterium]MDA0859459.1 cysteine desulfurase family protein [Bacteroidota bacterium]MDA1317954.1 cysteine desulfurase family protein [Bacteroidota bacterium]
MTPIYLDNAATTCVREDVANKMAEVLKSTYGNPSSTHSVGRYSKSILEQCRKRIASHFNVKSSEIVFTSGGTEADNLVLRSAVYDLDVKHIISSKIEHHAVGHTIEALQLSSQIKVSYVHLTEKGEVDLKHLEELLKNSSEKTLVSLMHINNEIGTILDLKFVAELCKTYDALFHSDTVQSVGHYHLDLQKIPIDFLAASAHKFHGPKGIGFAFVRSGLGLQPIITGGSQERGCRAGTESLHDIVGLDESLAIAYTHLETEKQFISTLKSYFINRLKSEVPGVKFNGYCDDFEKSTYTLVNVCLPVSSEKAPLFLFQLDLKGIACSKGSACQSGSDKGSHVLTEILSQDDLKKPSIRFSFSSYNTKEELDNVVDVLKNLVLETA